MCGLIISSGERLLRKGLKIRKTSITPPDSFFDLDIHEHAGMFETLQIDSVTERLPMIPHTTDFPYTLMILFDQFEPERPPGLYFPGPWHIMEPEQISLIATVGLLPVRSYGRGILCEGIAPRCRAVEAEANRPVVKKNPKVRMRILIFIKI